MTPRALLASLALVAAAGLLGGLSARAAEKKAKPFSHVQHKEDGGVSDCATCHDAKRPGRVALLTGACTECHDEGVPPYTFPRATRRSTISFSHPRHAKVACETCHAAAVADEAPPRGRTMEAGPCFACHRQRRVKVAQGACRLCHGVDMRRVEPADHARAWKTRHGEESIWRWRPGHGEDCRSCHRDSGCRSCHATSAPSSHNGTWRTRLHAYSAEWDRDRCAACHAASSCVRCHLARP